MTHPAAFPTFSDDTGQQRLAAGDKPAQFWINSMGEYGHRWTSGVETINGSVDLRKVAEAHGIAWEPPYYVPQDLLEDAFTTQLYKECVDPAELVLHRLWTLFQPFGSSLWRFYGAIEYVKEALNTTVLDMSIEYVLNKSDAHLLEALAGRHGGKVEAMHEDFEDSTRTQYGVDFDVLGKGAGEVGALQLRWLTDARSLNDHLVSVL